MSDLSPEGPEPAGGDVRPGPAVNHPESVDPPVFAALDLGTNNCRLLIAEPARHGTFRIVDAFSRIVRLGEGLASHGRIAEAAIERTLDALQVCAGRMRRRKVTHIRAIATEACRRATNGADFLARARSETGIVLEVISPAEEAQLAVAGCTPLLDPDRRRALVFDIGGGSTELAWLAVKGPDRAEMLDWMSMPLGVVTLAERFGGIEVDDGVYGRMVAEVRAALAPFAARYPAGLAAGDHGFQLLGTSGTVTTLAAVRMNLPRYDRTRVDGSWMTAAEIGRVIDDIRAMSFDRRAANPCIGRDRADLVLAGCAILEAIMEAWPERRLRIADRGLREGVLMGLMAGNRI
ncbi:Ppx/GppA phosphatase family protein [Zavarzinia compransoris]|uniref:Ppx/GppA phosphatase family protein n=1 Tax=Zavarzinia compransoris TaxID=1264899 RepID=UPI0010CF69B6|nr:Ppx/GppA phosphatase family protein [Zavarzinia compransoris]TDP46205.1 exopolyphosphatase/guanosine-5'-triphosphate,3'-diphosphate pyrophosphatase [Zavarzinia compransoris]